MSPAALCREYSARLGVFFVLHVEGFSSGRRGVLRPHVPSDLRGHSRGPTAGRAGPSPFAVSTSPRTSSRSWGLWGAANLQQWALGFCEEVRAQVSQRTTGSGPTTKSTTLTLTSALVLAHGGVSSSLHLFCRNQGCGCRSVQFAPCTWRSALVLDGLYCR